jgi:hypothetical protein
VVGLAAAHDMTTLSEGTQYSGIACSERDSKASRPPGLAGPTQTPRRTIWGRLGLGLGDVGFCQADGEVSCSLLAGRALPHATPHCCKALASIRPPRTSTVVASTMTYFTASKNTPGRGLASATQQMAWSSPQYSTGTSPLVGGGVGVEG